MAQRIAGYVLMSKREGSTDFLVRDDTYVVEKFRKPNMSYEGAMETARQAAEKMGQRWAAVEPTTQFRIETRGA
jgi:hypothetical protein